LAFRRVQRRIIILLPVTCELARWCWQVGRRRSGWRVGERGGWLRELERVPLQPLLAKRHWLLFLFSNKGQDRKDPRNCGVHLDLRAAETAVLLQRSGRARRSPLSS
jgi:hypothetical protein